MKVILNLDRTKYFELKRFLKREKIKIKADDLLLSYFEKLIETIPKEGVEE